MNKKIRSYSTKKKKKTIKTVLQSYEQNGKRKETSIEKKVRIFLENSGIPFVQEKFYKHKDKEKWSCYDFYLSDGVNYTILVECDGDFFHHTKDDKTKKLHKIQKKNIKNDKAKDKLAKDLGIPLLRFTETEINKKFNFVKEHILDEITRQTNHLSSSNNPLSRPSE